MIPDQSKADFSLALHRNDTFTILDQLEMISYLTDEPITLTTQNSTAEISTMIRQTGPPCYEAKLSYYDLRFYIEEKDEELGTKSRKLYSIPLMAPWVHWRYHKLK